MTNIRSIDMLFLDDLFEMRGGYDLYETLNRGLPLQDVLSLKVRRAAETGFPFIRVRDLFPD